jgi:raffinose/stachyose/melibiose transport system substrate-binding protein
MRGIRSASRLGWLGAALLLLASCAQPGAQTGSSGGWKGTITMYAQAYTPDARNQNNGFPTLHAFQQVASRYEKLHPGVTIQFIDQNYQANLEQVIRAKAAAGQMFDVYWEQNGNLNTAVLPKGIAVDLNQYFDQPNPYISGNKRWRDAMNPRVLSVTAAPDGAHYMIDGDYVTTAFYYNKDLFKKAGIASVPNTWAGLLDACRKLQKIGVKCASGMTFQSWWESLFLSSFYAGDYQKMASYDSDPSGMSLLDGAAAVSNGLLSPKDPRYTAWLPMLRQLTAYWDQQYLDQDPLTAEAPARTEFLTGKVAMSYDGSWLGPQIRHAGARFNWGVFPFPTLSSSDSPYATGTPTGGVVGGYAAGYQFAMSTPKADSTMQDSGKASAVLDWMRYIGTAQTIQDVADELGAYVPTWPGAKPAPQLQPLLGQVNVDYKGVSTPALTADLGTKMQTIFGLYLHGDMPLDAARSQISSAVDGALSTYEQTNHVQLHAYA